jgi:hypothetical protein
LCAESKMRAVEAKLANFSRRIDRLKASEARVVKRAGAGDVARDRSAPSCGGVQSCDGSIRSRGRVSDITNEGNI